MCLKTLFAVLATLCLTLVAAAQTPSPAPIPAVAPASLLPNGDFETLDNGLPAHWLKENTANMSLQAEDGNHFLRLKATEPEKMVLVYRVVPLKGQQALELSYRVRFEGIQRGSKEWFDGRIMMNFKDSSGKVLKGSPAPPIFKGTSKGWEARSQKFMVPEGAATLEIMPCLFQAKAGQLDFDNFGLVALDEAAIASLKAAGDAAAAERAAKNAALEKKADDQIAKLLATGNLISNGDFAQANKAGDFARDWGSLKEGSGITWEQEDGKRFIRIKQTEAGKLSMLYRIVPLPTAARGIEISVRYRTADIAKGSQMPGDARMVAHWLSGGRTGHLEAGNPVKPEPPALGFGGKASEWTQVSRRTLVPEGATKLQLMPGLWFTKAGTLDLAEIRVMPISDADAEVIATEAAAAARKKAEQTEAIARDLALPAISPELKVSGNQLVTADGKAVWLQGLCVDSMEWGPGDNVLWSIRVALGEWKSNCIRLPVHHKMWFGKEHKGTPAGDPEKYRKVVDDAVKLCAARGAYLVLDLHAFGAPMPEHVEFWKDAAARYKDNPAVIYELFNEPHGIGWKIWRDGGDLSKDTHQDNAVVENTEKNAGKISVGMQALLDAVRSTGARNIVVAGGISWSYDLSGILEGYALKDVEGAGGIMYSHHNYPWKKGWQKAVLDAAARHPIFVGEVGCPEKWEDFSFIKADERYEKLGPGCKWPADMLGTIQKYKLNWTGFSFHPRCGPMVIKDWDYTPTDYWGVYVKEALAGKVFEVEKIR